MIKKWKVSLRYIHRISINVSLVVELVSTCHDFWI